MFLGIALVGLALGIGACRALLPEKYAVNAPVWGILFARNAPAETELQKAVRLPDGFRISAFAEVERPRMLRFTETGDLLVSSPRQRAIYRVTPDGDGDGRADAVTELATGLDRPHGIDVRDGWLYVGEGSKITRAQYDAAAGVLQGQLEPVVTGLPGGGNHPYKTLGFGPDGWLYVHIGSSCNVCLEEDERRATIMRFRPDGSGGEIFASGLRNSVGFDWSPQDRAMYATDNGRDLLGDDFPPCEVNQIERGQFYGWPFANGDRVIDPDLGAGHESEIEESVPPVHGFVAHTAPLGITFYRGTTFPAKYRGQAFVAQHGSWNRSTKSGYRVVLVEGLDRGNPIETDFAVGWEQNERVSGRPVDLATGPDGALYVSDDFANVIYKIEYVGG